MAKRPVPFTISLRHWPKPDTLGARHLAAQIRIWLAPLLPAGEARTLLAEAHEIAEIGGRRLLLAEIERLRSAFTDREIAIR